MARNRSKRASAKAFRLTMPEPSESAVQRGALQMLDYEVNRGRVAFYWRNNVGAQVFEATATTKRSFVRYGFEGASDILGMLCDGRFLALEVKRPSGVVSKPQQTFLDRVNAGGGVGAVIRDIRDVKRVIDEALTEAIPCSENT